MIAARVIGSPTRGSPIPVLTREVEAGQRGEEAGCGEGGDDRAVNADTGQAGRFRAAADRVDGAPERRVMQEETHGQKGQEHDEAGDRDAEQPAVGEFLEPDRHRAGRPKRVEQHEAGQQGRRTDRHHERIDAGPDRDQAVQCAECCAGRENPDQHRNHQRFVGADRSGEQYGGAGYHRPDRQVDSADQHDERQAQAHETQGGGLLQNVHEIPEGAEALADEKARDDYHQQQCGHDQFRRIDAARA